MKDIIYIITGCLIFGICTIKAVDTITPNELSKAQVKLENSKNAYWDCLEFLGCGECNSQYQAVKNAYDQLNKIK